MILKKNNLQTVQERNKSYIELIALSLYVHPQKKQSSSMSQEPEKLLITFVI